MRSCLLSGGVFGVGGPCAPSCFGGGGGNAGWVGASFGVDCMAGGVLAGAATGGALTGRALTGRAAFGPGLTTVTAAVGLGGVAAAVSGVFSGGSGVAEGVALGGGASTAGTAATGACPDQIYK